MNLDLPYHSRLLKCLVISILSASLIPIAAFAVPAKQSPVIITQADGEKLPVRIVGDEYDHQYFTTDGYLLVNCDDIYYYAELDALGNPVSTGIRATETAKRTQRVISLLNSIDKNSINDQLNQRLKKVTRRKIPVAKGPGHTGRSAFPSKGKQKAIVILVEYSDIKFHASEEYDAHDYFTRMMSEKNFSSFGGTGSAKDFFMDSSAGQFEPEFDVYGPVTLTKTRAYYGGDGLTGKDTNAYRMAIEACQQLDGTVDFSEYDRDGDGYIDNVFIFYAGEGQHMGASADSVWPHAYSISDKDSTPYIFDGVRLDRYGCTCEWVEGRPDGVGTFVHEFSHVMGLPDLYTTNYNTAAFTPGSWSTLDAGPYNNNGCTPPLYSTFERYALDWITPVEINGSVSATLPALGNNLSAIIRTPDENEFFLLENRQQTGWDKYLPGHGMLVWHVDYEKSIWFTNGVNNDENHQYVDLEEADNLKTAVSRGGDAFPGTAGITSFTDDTNPSMRAWDNSRLNIPITDIDESNGLITFKALGGSDALAAPKALNPDFSDHESFTALWEASKAGSEYLLSVYTKGDDSEINYLPGYYRRNVGTATSHTITGLTPSTTYYFVVYTAKGLESSQASNEVSVFTERMPLDKLTVNALEADEVDIDVFTAHWELLPEATDYRLSVYCKVPGGELEDVCDFTGGINSLPDGWTSSSTTGYTMSSYIGKSAPSLRMGLDSDNIITPVYSDGIKKFSFWHRGNGTSSSEKIIVYAFKQGVWETIGEYAIVTDKGGKTITIETIPAGAESVKIEFKKVGSKSSLAIDDVTVFHGVKYVPENLPSYDAITTGNVSSYKVTGLQRDSEYFYTLTATDGNLVSRVSNEIAVRTRLTSGINSTLATKVSVHTYGDAIFIKGLEAGSSLDVTDISGRVVANSIADSEGSVSVSVPSKGVYILSTSDHQLCIKVVIK